MNLIKKLIGKGKSSSADINNISTWVSSLAHEIKNPLNTIRLNIDLLKEDWQNSENSQDEKVIRRLNIMDKEISRLEQILNDFLRYARLPMPNPEKYNLALILDELLDFSEPEARQLKIDVKRYYNRDLPELYIDRSQIKQALINILINAYQSMPDGGVLVIQVIKLDSALQIDISDNGNGIPEDKLDQIFNLFYSTKEDGTGLGLPIARRIIEMHNGEIKVKSQIGKGTTFSVFLPIKN
jgi:signal transduction histidine kinase